MKKILKKTISKIIYFIFNFIFQYLFKKKIALVSFDAARIGNMAYSTEHFLRRLSLGKGNIKYFGIAQNLVSNNFLFSMFKRKIKIFQINIRLYNFLTSCLKSSPYFSIATNPYNDYEAFNNKKTKPTLSFSKDEEIKGKKLLKDLGIPTNGWFVCFHARTPNYLKQNSKKLYGTDFDFSYQDFRNCDINNFVDAMKFIISKGGYAIVMGREDNAKLNYKHEKIINYSKNNWSEFGDIYLSAKCKMFVGSNSGLICVPFIFNRPVILTNWNNLCGFLPNENLVKAIPVKIWSKKLNRFLTYGEVFKDKIWNYNVKYQYIDNQLEIYENSREDILDITKEFYTILTENYSYNNEECAIREKFNNLIKSDHPSYKTPIYKSIGVNFLKKNLNLVQ